jgi:hypothetical protein
MVLTNVNEYNKFTEFPNLSYNCITYLLDNNELIWKLLKYNDSNAWSKDDLTAEEKRLLIYSGQPDQTNYRVFMDLGNDDSWNEQTSILRISPIELNPVNYIVGSIYMGFEIYVHYSCNHLSNYKARTNVIAQQMIETFNGVEIGGLGRLYFDSNYSSRCTARMIGQIPYKGMAVVMCNYLAG